MTYISTNNIFIVLLLIIVLSAGFCLLLSSKETDFYQERIPRDLKTDFVLVL